MRFAPSSVYGSYNLTLKKGGWLDKRMKHIIYSMLLALGATIVSSQNDTTLGKNIFSATLGVIP